MGTRKRKLIVCSLCKKRKPRGANGWCDACYRRAKRALSGSIPKHKMVRHLNPNWQGGRDVYCCICGDYAGWRSPSAIKRNKTGVRCPKHQHARIARSRQKAAGDGPLQLRQEP